MCLAAFALQVHPRFPLVVATNRDEFYARPTRAARWWSEAEAGGARLWAGRDERGGGTWLGATAAGRFALLTNVREPAHHRDDARTRGALVTGFLRGDERPATYLDRTAAERDRYNGFNLVCGTLAGQPTLWVLHHGHEPAGRAGRVEPVTEGVHGLSNAALDTPWPKTEGLLRETAPALAEHATPGALTESLFAALADRSLAPDAALPDTGVGLDWERRLSARFIVGEAYGTRASTVLLVDAEGRVRVEERRFGPGGEALGRTAESWRLGD